MDKTVKEWKRRFVGMESEQLLNAWKAKIKDEVSWIEDSNFHVAVAERMKQIGHMAIDLDDETRLKLCVQANDILEKLQKHLINQPDKTAQMEKAVGESDEYHSKYGSRTARYYMFEQGMIDRLGDRLKVG